ncbi:MAG: hypothetical protein IIC82_05385, partial [Chloroflexi bacterium]|nr:hypothetical protein [Chloroflexota bacterium]
MPNWYVGRERVKRAVGINGVSNNAIIDPYIESASRTIEREMGRRFIPKTETRNFRWPQDADVASRHRKGNTLYLA